MTLQQFIGESLHIKMVSPNFNEFCKFALSVNDGYAFGGVNGNENEYGITDFNGRVLTFNFDTLQPFIMPVRCSILITSNLITLWHTVGGVALKAVFDENRYMWRLYKGGDLYVQFNIDTPK